MPSEIVATLTARKTLFLGIVMAEFHLTETGRVIFCCAGPGGGVITLRGDDGSLRDFSSTPAADCFAALRAAAVAEGWEVAS